MTRRRRVFDPRWRRALIAASFAASAVIGAAVGLESRVATATLAAALEATTLAGPTTGLVQTYAPAPTFVIPQTPARTPYGTSVTLPHLGVPADLAASDRASLSCDLIDGSISQTLLVVDANGDPVVGAYVLFTVTRSDIAEPQLVSDVSDFSGSVTVTVKVPQLSADSLPAYFIEAEVFQPSSPVPVASTRFTINQFTCTGVAGDN